MANASLRAIFEKTNDVELLKEMVPKIVKYVDKSKGVMVDTLNGSRTKELSMKVVSLPFFTRGKAVLISVQPTTPH